MTERSKPGHDNIGPTVAEAYLRHLGERGIEYILANAGTDFPPIIEALTRAAEEATPTPKALAIPHENLAIAMAHGHTMVSGRPQTVMLHVNVGTANAICGLLNAARERIPMMVATGRTPFTDAGHEGSRSLYIHWGQEMFDQAAMLREIVKWDYELKLPDQVGQAVERAFALAESEPKGPVYLTLPRETLAAHLPADYGKAHRAQASARPAAPEKDAIAEAATLLAKAERPVIITSSVGRDFGAVRALESIAERFALPVVCHIPKTYCLSTAHKMHFGFDPAPFLAEADVVIVIECDVPWVPSRAAPRADARIVHIGADPLFGRYPMRTFPADLALTGDARTALEMLESALEVKGAVLKSKVDARRPRLAAKRKAMREKIEEDLTRFSRETPIHPAAVSRAIDRVRGEDGILVNELGVLVDFMHFTKPGTYFSSSSAGGLGWGLGAALGAKLASPERLVIAAIGDGSYMFGNPTPAHYISRAHDLPILYVVMNNAGWAAVRKATETMYPDGRSLRANRMPLSTLEPSPAFEKVVEASGGYGERVETLEDLAPAFERAMHAIKVEKRQALLNVNCGVPAVRNF
ncbi:MAG TPA: thiamine pyrophosphate-requiring protein [Alphaproteobacteria bacterium]|nr:thiamine pyrophosphate-requiring protein [Alphaproteobacteria bacterium]